VIPGWYVGFVRGFRDFVRMRGVSVTSPPARIIRSAAFPFPFKVPSFRRIGVHPFPFLLCGVSVGCVTSLYTESGVVERELGCADDGIMCVENGEEASFNDGTGNRFRSGVIGSIASTLSALSPSRNGREGRTCTRISHHHNHQHMKNLLQCSNWNEETKKNLNPR
jgi:hypothetical protein